MVPAYIDTYPFCNAYIIICTILLIIFYNLPDSGDEELNEADEEGIVIDDYDDFADEEVDNEKGLNKKKSSIILSTDILKKTGVRNRISIDFNATETTKEIPKGQLNSEWISEVIVSPKMETKNYKDFCPTKQTRIVALFLVIFWWV